MFTIKENVLVKKGCHLFEKFEKFLKTKIKLFQFIQFALAIHEPKAFSVFLRTRIGLHFMCNMHFIPNCLE